MKKREKRLNLSRETLRNLMTPARDAELLAAAGGTCTTRSAGSDATFRICCDSPNRVPKDQGRRSRRAKRG
jgi:hypothetical protein